MNHTLGKRSKTESKDWMGNMSSIGYGQLRDNIIAKMQSLIKAIPILTPWVDDKPSYKWYNLFMNQHPKSCIFPWKPELLDTSKLYAAEVYNPRSEWNRPLPTMIDTCINEGNEQCPEEENIELMTSNNQQEVEQSDK